MQEAVQQKGFLGLGEVFKREIFRYPVVPCGSKAPNDLMFFDLSFDPQEIFDLDTQEIYSMVQKPAVNLDLSRNMELIKPFLYVPVK